jgi:signal transduction histidine kinase
MIARSYAFLLIGLLGISLLASGAFALFTYRNNQDRAEQVAEESYRLAATGVANALSFPLKLGDLHSAYKLVNGLQLLVKGGSVIIDDPGGRMIFRSPTQPPALPKGQPVKEIRVPILYSHDPVGTLTLRYPSIRAPSARSDIVGGAALFSILAAACFTVWWAHRRSNKALDTLINQMQEIDPNEPEPLVLREQARSAEHSFVRNLNALIGRMKAAGRELRELAVARSLSQLASQVAHDIRSPLAALNAVIDGLAELPEEERVLIRSAVARISDISNNLLEANRAGGTYLPIVHAAPAAVVHLLPSMVDELLSEKRQQYRTLHAVRIEAETGAQSYGLFARVDAGNFKRVLSNLVNNAIEALPGPGLVRVRIRGDEQNVFISVRDNGIGIPAEKLARVTERGFSFGKENGSGLGLHHARNTVEAWGGGLELSSVEGEGTTVTIRLPRATPPAWFIPELNLRAGVPVVVVDDDSSMHQGWAQRFRSLSLDKEKINVVHLSTPAELLLWHEANGDKPATYLVDYEFLGFRRTGLDLIRDLHLEAEAILVTSRYDEPAVRELCEEVPVRLIPKGRAAFVPIRVAET